MIKGKLFSGVYEPMDQKITAKQAAIRIVRGIQDIADYWTENHTMEGLTENEREAINTQIRKLQNRIHTMLDKAGGVK